MTPLAVMAFMSPFFHNNYFIKLKSKKINLKKYLRSALIPDTAYAAIFSIMDFESYRYSSRTQLLSE